VTPSGIGPRDAVTLVRHVQSAASPKGPLLVTGVLAETLARELRAGGDASLVRTDGNPADAAAVVRVVAGAATPEDERVLRAATRALVPTVVVQTGPPSARIPYVLATDVVQCEPGKGFPVDRVARALAATLGPDGPPIAGVLPVLREAVQRRRIERGAAAAGALAVAGGEAQRFPVLALAQARLLADVAAAGGAGRPEAPRAVAEAVVPPLAVGLGAGLAARALVRRLPLRNRLLDGAVAAAVTYALATAFRRFVRR
jgi:hypothetical protein